MKTYDKIMYAALKSFLTIGIDQTSLNTIADAVNIKKPSIYYHFKSKEDLITKCVTNIIDDLEHRIELSIKQNDTPKEQIESIYECVIEFNQDLSIMVYNNSHQIVNLTALFQRASMENEAIKTKIEAYYHMLQTKLISMLSHGQKQGMIKNSINKEIVSIDLIARIDGLITLSSIYSGANLSIHRHSLYESLWNSLKTEHTAPKKKKLLDYKSIDLGRKW